MVNTKLRLIIFFAAEDGNTLYSQQNQDRELTVTHHELLIAKFTLKLRKVGKTTRWFSSVQFSSVAELCTTHCDSMNCSTPGFPVYHQLPKLAQTHVHWVSDAIQPSHPLSPPSPPAFNLSQHQGLFQWVSSSHHMAKGLEFQLQHQSFQWIFRTDFL